jgi:hypothetical protein
MFVREGPREPKWPVGGGGKADFQLESARDMKSPPLA